MITTAISIDLNYPVWYDYDNKKTALAFSIAIVANASTDNHSSFKVTR